jgi:hypothetical protein
VLRKRLRTNKSAYNGEPVLGIVIGSVVFTNKHCKFQIAKCKLQIENPSGNTVGSRHQISNQFEICILQLAICNVLTLWLTP